MTAVKHKTLTRPATVTLFVPGKRRQTVELPREASYSSPQEPWTRPGRNLVVEVAQRMRDAVREARFLLSRRGSKAPAKT